MHDSLALTVEVYIDGLLRGDIHPADPEWELFRNYISSMHAIVTWATMAAIRPAFLGPMHTRQIQAHFATFRSAGLALFEPEHIEWN